MNEGREEGNNKPILYVDQHQTTLCFNLNVINYFLLTFDPCVNYDYDYFTKSIGIHVSKVIGNFL